MTELVSGPMSAHYRLGIDFGTTDVAAAVRRGGDVEVIPLGAGSDAVPCALHLSRDGRVTVGDGALRLAGIDAGRVVRALKRRVGDPAPIVLGRESWTAEQLSARLVRWVVDRVAEREGGPAAEVALAHPASWTAPTLERLAAALADQDVPVTFVPEPQAVAAAAGDGSADPVAVYDLGGGRFDAAVVRRCPASPSSELLGRPEALADVSGLAFDDLVRRHVQAHLPEGAEADARTRRLCLRAKETLSTKSEVVVRVRRDDLKADVRLDRATFEGLIGPHVDRTVAALRRTLASAGLESEELGAVLLVGGSSRIPLVAQRVTAALGRPVTVVEADQLVARGAALVEPAAESSLPAPAIVVTRPVVAAEPPAPLVPAAVEVAVPAAEAPTVTIAVPVPAAAPPAPEPVAAEPVAVEPAAELAAAEPVVAEPAVAEPVAVEHVAAETAAAGSTPPAPRAAPVRVPAVLDPVAPRGNRPRSLGRLLVGAGAVVVAALVVVALFRADGPLDPPITAVAGDGAARIAGAPAVPHPLPTGTAPPPAVAVVQVEDAAAAIMTTPPARPRAVPAPAGAAAPSPVGTTPPAAPGARPTGSGPSRRVAAQAEAPVGAAPRVPPTPAAPVL